MGVNVGSKLGGKTFGINILEENLGENGGGGNHKLWGKILGVKSGGKTLGVKVGVKCLGDKFLGENMEEILRAKVREL